MSVVSAIYKAPIVTEVIDENIGDTIIGILYDGKLFTGNAKLAENDKGFYSYRVGRNIALSKARMNAMNYEIKKSRKEMEYRYDFYQEATKYGKAGPAEVDPTGNFYHAITRYISRISALKKALKTYIKNQTKALSIVRKFRQGNNN